MVGFQPLNHNKQKCKMFPNDNHDTPLGVTFILCLFCARLFEDKTAQLEPPLAARPPTASPRRLRPGDVELLSVEADDLVEDRAEAWPPTPALEGVLRLWEKRWCLRVPQPIGYIYIYAMNTWQGWSLVRPREKKALVSWWILPEAMPC